MPQTEEEHLYGLDDENESVEDQSHNDQHRNTEADVEVMYAYQMFVEMLKSIVHYCYLCDCSGINFFYSTFLFFFLINGRFCRLSKCYSVSFNRKKVILK